MEDTPLAEATSDTGLWVRTHGRTRVALHRIDVPVGVGAGWHYHLGRVIGLVVSGTLTRTLADGTEQTTGQGGVVVEPEGPDRVHHFHNHGPTPLTMFALYLLPADAPLSCPAPSPDVIPEFHRPERGSGDR
ncbi:cupin domain-containing protein [Streptomyces lasiicapitis]|uniref:cupin domain-containing protein n=1 Tax=Streptomyces lasiicapitis TaxID=1923961 RepID=UPI001662B112|nr:cupin domain-containing protein [Streptomyces lasiicapitis]